ncbi:MAG: ArnT family glycosyltransferase [Deltaproteobacteria bacterium]
MSAGSLPDCSRLVNLLPHRSRWWLEPELALLVALVVGAYFSRMTALTVRGEESRRGLIAREMLATGDWIVPRCQGIPLFSRPPLQNWLIALVAVIRGDVDIVALRFPSDCAVLLTVILIYGYARAFLTRLGALTAGAAYASMGQVVELGRTGETDALFALFVSGSLLVWHFCQVRGESPYKTWCLGYLLAALGTLTKGPQAPVYFAGAIAAYLLLTRQWRFAFSRAHAAGIGVFALVYGAWQIPFLLTMGLEGAGKMYVNDVGHRFLGADWPLFFKHLAEYPFEILICVLPWSGLLIVWCNRQFRRTQGQARHHALFLALCLAIALPTVWLPPDSRPRYLFCLFPCLALLVGIAADRVARTRSTAAWRIVWPVFVRASALAMAGIVIFVLVVSLGDLQTWLKQPPAWALPYAQAGLAIAALAWWSPARHTPLRRRTAVLAIAGFVAVSHDTIVIHAFQGTTVDTAGAIAEVKKHIPAGAKLVSIGQTHHIFAYLYHEHVSAIPFPESPAEAEDVEYFCFDAHRTAADKLPFSWEPIGEVNCDRHRLPYVRWRVVVARRTDAAAMASRRQSSASAN